MKRYIAILLSISIAALSPAKYSMTVNAEVIGTENSSNADDKASEVDGLNNSENGTEETQGSSATNATEAENSENSNNDNVESTDSNNSEGENSNTSGSDSDNNNTGNNNENSENGLKNSSDSNSGSDSDADSDSNTKNDTENNSDSNSENTSETEINSEQNPDQPADESTTESTTDSESQAAEPEAPETEVITDTEESNEIDTTSETEESNEIDTTSETEESAKPETSTETQNETEYDENVITDFEELTETEFNNEYKLGLERQLQDFPTEITIETGGEEGSEETIEVTWECVQDYDEYLGEYEFVPVIEDYEIAEDVELPVIVVKVANEEDGATGDISGDNYDLPELVASGDDYSSSSLSYYNGFEDADYLPSIRNQGSEGCCWAFSSIGTIETDLIKKGYSDTSIDLSELQLAYFTTFNYTDPKGLHNNDTVTYSGDRNKYLSLGGSTVRAYHYIMDQVGPIAEKYAPYEKGTSYDMDDSYALNRNFGHVKNAYVIAPSDKDSIKAAILKHGSVAVSIYSSSQYSATYNSMYGTQKSSNHSVMVVGWDDNFPKENFHESLKPESNGAWLIRNSWGLDDYGKSGYFWLSYCDYAFLYNGKPAICYDVDLDGYDNCYSYDGHPVNINKYNFKNGDYITQTYTISGGESLKAVACEVDSADADIRITLTYAGKNVSFDKHLVIGGYYTFDLDKEISFDTDTDVLVKVENVGNKEIIFPVEINSIYQNKDNTLKYTPKMGGKSTLKVNGVTENASNDARIKVFTDNTNGKASNVETSDKTIKLASTSVSGHYKDVIQLALTQDSNVAISDLTFKAIDEKIAIIDANGRITVGASKGSTVIEGSYNGKKVVECTVTVLPYRINYAVDKDVKARKVTYSFYPGDNRNCVLATAANFAKPGYSLEGWTTTPGEKTVLTCNKEGDKVGGYQHYYAEYLYNATGDVTLYPKWTSRQLLVNFYEPNTDLKTYKTTTHKLISLSSASMPYNLPTTAFKYDSPQIYENSDYKLGYWSTDKEGKNRVDVLTANIGFSVKYNINTKEYEQNSEIALYPQYVIRYPVTGISFNQKNKTIQIGSSEKLGYKLSPSNAINKKVSFVSSDNTIVSVDAGGNISAKAVGTATITVTTDESAFKDSIAITVNSPITGATVKVLDQTYTGSGLTPNVSVNLGGRALQRDKDYSVVYSNNKNVGAATYKVTGCGYYFGEMTGTFNIAPKSLEACSISGVSYVTYTGNEIKPSVSVTDKGTALKAGNDYNVSYLNNVDVGTATVTIVGEGNYTGSKSVSFNINAPVVSKASILNLVNGNGFVQININPANDVSGYKLYRNGEFVATITNGTSYKDTSANVDKSLYAYKVQAFKTIGSKEFLAEESAETKTYYISGTSIKKLKNNSKNKVTVTWKKNKKCSGYEISYTTGKVTKTVSVSSASKLEKVISKLKKGKKYTFKIRTFYKVNGKKYYSPWSKAKNIKIKKG